MRAVNYAKPITLSGPQLLIEGALVILADDFVVKPSQWHLFLQTFKLRKCSRARIPSVILTCLTIELLNHSVLRLNLSAVRGFRYR